MKMLNLDFARWLRAAVICTVVVVAGRALADMPGPPPVRALRYPTPTGRITYEMKSSGPIVISTTMTVTWADYGGIFRQDSCIRWKHGAQTRTTNAWSIYDGQSMYEGVPGAQRRAMRMKVTRDMLAQMKGGMVGSLSQFNIEGGQAMGTGVVLGKRCNIHVATVDYTLLRVRVKMWRWQGLTLRAEIAERPITRPGQRRFSMTPMNMTMVATQLNLAAETSPSMFALPSGYTVQEMERRRPPGQRRGEH